MTKAMFAIAVMLALLTAADAKTRRVPVFTGPERTNYEIICPWVSGSVAWDWPQAQQKLMLGTCPPPAAPR